MMTNNDLWKIVEIGKHEEAVEGFTLLIEDSEKKERIDRFAIMNRGFVYLLLGQVEKSLADFTQVHKKLHDHAFEWIGVALWLMGDYDEACKYWLSQCDAINQGRIKYVDAAGGVHIPCILWWASCHPECRKWSDVARNHLEYSINRDKFSLIWPGPLALFLVNRIGFGDLQSLVNSSSVELEKERFLQTLFFASCESLSRDKYSVYKDGIYNSLSQGQYIY